MKTVFAFLLFLLTALGSWAQSSGVTVELQLDQEQYLPDEDLMADVRVVNRSGQTLHFGPGNDWVSFSIQEENSRMAAKLAELPATEAFELQSAKVATRQFNLTPCFNIRRQGKYRVIATVTVPGWNQQISSAPITFNILNGVRLANLPDLQFGVPLPPGETNRVPEMRTYVLQKASYLKQLRLYFRLMDSWGKTLKVFPIERMVSFSVPEAQIDQFSRLHVLHQTGAKAFNYSVISPDGEMLVRQTHDYTDTRPTLRSDSEGRIYVAGGIRRVTLRDIPPPSWSVPAPAPAPAPAAEAVKPSEAAAQPDEVMAKRSEPVKSPRAR